MNNTNNESQENKHKCGSNFNEIEHHDCCGGDHDHDCCCDHGNEHPETIMLTLDDDTEMECTVVGIFDVEDVSYIALVSNEEEQLLLYRFIEDEEANDFTLENIESEEEFNTIIDVFFTLFGDESQNSDED